MSAVDWVLQSTGGIAADIGAGTGALTRLIQQRVNTVLAVEPDKRMLAMLRRRSPDTPSVQSWAEALPLRPGVLDAVTISSAWHWMKPEQTLAEIGRVLRPKGVLGVIWNGADRSVEWVAELLGKRDPSPGERHRRSRHVFELTSHAPFTGLEGTTIHWSMPATPEQLVGLAGTYSATITMSPAQRDQELTRVRGAVNSMVGDGELELPMSCRCWRAVRT
jgi:SAM-dependent methyltransferase